MVKAVLGAINPSDIATKRLSISRLESQLYLLGIWDSANNSLVGQHDPGRIFQKCSATSAEQRLPDIRSTCWLAPWACFFTVACRTCQVEPWTAIFKDQLCRQPSSPAGSPCWLCTWCSYGWAMISRFTMKFWPAVMMMVWLETQPDFSCEGLPDFPAFSPEALISWLFERCYRRREDSISNGNTSRALAYTQRMTLLVDLLDQVMGSGDTARQEATDMLNTVSDLSSDEASPTRATDEPWESKKKRLTTAHAAMISLQGSMTMGLGGCLGADMDETAQNNSGSSQFSFLVLTLWTLLLAAYTWWMLRSPFLRSVPMPPPMPTELAVGPVVNIWHQHVGRAVDVDIRPYIGQACKGNLRQQFGKDQKVYRITELASKMFCTVSKCQSNWAWAHAGFSYGWQRVGRGR